MRFLIWIAILYGLYLLLRKKRAAQLQKDEPAAEETYLDPVCGTYVGAGDAVVGRLGDKRLHFCSIQCLEKYRDSLPRDPETP